MSELRAAPAYLGQVATSGMVPNGFAEPNKQLMSRVPHWACDTLTLVQIVYGNWNVAALTGAADGTEVTIGSAAMTIEASIESPAGVFTRVQFSAANQGSCAAGATIVSDACAVAIPAGAQFWTRTWVSNADGVQFCNVSPFGNLLAYGVTTTNYVMSAGTIAASASLGYGPLAIIGQTRKPSLFLLGDSICAGIGETTDATLHRGVLARSLNGLGYINMGVDGDYATNVATKFTKRGALAAYCSHVICQLSVNDLLNGRTAAQAHTDLQTIYAFAAFAGKPIWQTTATPFGVGQSGGYVSDANQTAHGSNAARVTFNDTLRGGIAGIRGVIDVAGVLESATKTGVWATDRGANALTGDGTHPNRRGYLRVQSANVIMPGMFVR